MHESHKGNTFWFGFSVGAAAIGLGAILFGTKKGRETLGVVLEFSQNLEENLGDLLKGLEEAVTDEAGAIGEELRKTPAKTKPTFSNILDKIRHFSDGSPKGKKFFVKDK